MTDKTYQELLDELDSYNERTNVATDTYENSLTDIQTAVDSCNQAEQNSSVSSTNASSAAVRAEAAA